MSFVLTLARILRAIPFFNAPYEVSAERRAGFYALFERAAVPCINLTLHADAPEVPPGGSRLGGRPDLPEDVAWPRVGERPLAFLLQLNLAELAAYDLRRELPPTGLLLIFYDLEDCEQARVLYVEEGVPTTPAEYPPALADAYRLGERALSFEATTIPPTDIPDELLEECRALCEGDEDETRDCWVELRAQYTNHAHADDYGTFLLGVPEEIQGPVAQEGERLLFQLASVEDGKGRLVFGDWGNAYVLIAGEDLAARDFSRVRADMQCF